ncbi:hypothetical protein BO70DRAFT_332787 [Aspergillus heteromorphus CBS 117.55]|uniref:Small secreted protein n=1 Tax=Aspergillus heteromorphus CBS 117.55 TaxID=1448321 RepID=A0A317WQX1_9EURO|nr:uncharacterized protein BO70DRAFT_332787 [Aspergillus heteromorphus CBS 117.55]PWY87672.1 hypothetical protein BO70DRAFT_332787 [Aspergillus heteromorphus CBS 117.55]
MTVLPTIFSLLFATTATATIPSTLNITTITAHNDQSAIECWALDPGFTTTDQAGVSGTASISLGPVAGNVTNIIVPGAFDGGSHNAPALQWVIFLSGVAHVTLPHSDDEAWIVGGRNGAILALDTADVSVDGHITQYPTQESTVAVEVPLVQVPGHRVLHGGLVWRGRWGGKYSVLVLGGGL